MNYEDYKAAAMEELKSDPIASKDDSLFVRTSTKTSSFSLICGMLMAAVIGFLATDTDLPLLKQLNLNGSGREAVGSVLSSFRSGGDQNVSKAPTKRSLESHFDAIAAVSEEADDAEAQSARSEFEPATDETAN